jgi:hypothetical protein
VREASFGGFQFWRFSRWLVGIRNAGLKPGGYITAQKAAGSADSPALQNARTGLNTGHYIAGSGSMPTGIGMASFAVVPFRKVVANRIAEMITQSHANQSPKRV